MIRLFNRDETNFNHNETILTDVLSAKVIEEGNGMFEVEIEHQRNEFAKTLTAGKVVKVPTARGDQLFRIYKPVKNLTRYKLYARHIFYDLAKNFIEDIRPTNKGGMAAINDILSAAQYEHPFIGTSDISNLGTAYYVRMNPIQAMMSADNSFLDTWGGELVRDNFTFSIDAAGGSDRGYEIRIGKNLTGIDVDMDETAVYTRLYPTVVINDNVVTNLPEKYVDSPLIEAYEYPKIIEERISLTDDQKGWPIEDIYTLMRDHCAALFESGIDKPVINYKVNFVELSKTEQYKELQILEQLDLYDTVTIRVAELDIDIKAKVVKTTYDGLKERYISMELGSFMDNMASQTKNTLAQTDKKINAATSSLQQAFDKAQSMITGNLGGYRIDRYNAEGLPYETLWMDTPDINTAVNVIRINQQGIGFSQSGYNGPFKAAITIDGHIVADFIDTGTLTADLIATGTVTGLNMEINLDGGQQTFVHPVSGDTLIFKQGEIFFRNGDNTRHLRYSPQGLIMEPGAGNTGTALNTGFILAGPDGSNKYIDFFNSGLNTTQRIVGVNETVRIHTNEKVEFRKNVAFNGTDAYNPIRASGVLIGDGTEGLLDGGDGVAILEAYNMIDLRIRDVGVMQLYENGIACWGEMYMNGHTIWDESDLTLKTNVLPTTIDAIAETKKQKVIEFEWDKSNPHNEGKPEGKQFGLSAQHSGILQLTPEETGKGYMGVNLIKEIHLATLTNQKLIKRMEYLELRVAELETKE